MSIPLVQMKQLIYEMSDMLSVSILLLVESYHALLQRWWCDIINQWCKNVGDLVINGYLIKVEGLKAFSGDGKTWRGCAQSVMRKGT